MTVYKRLKQALVQLKVRQREEKGARSSSPRCIPTMKEKWVRNRVKISMYVQILWRCQETQVRCIRPCIAHGLVYRRGLKYEIRD